MCVGESEFRPLRRGWGEQGLEGFWGAGVGLVGKGRVPGVVRAALTRWDGVEGLEVERLSVEGLGGGRGVCRDCVGVGMEVAEGWAGGEGLRVQARLMAGVGVGVGGVLWVAALLG